MATATQKKVDTKAKPGNAVAVKASAELAERMNFAADSGGGMEGATAESFAIPFLGVLQKGSPQVDEASGVALDGAKSGMFYENVTGELMDGKAGVMLIPAAYRRVFVRWGARGTEGSGFKGELTPDEIGEMRSKGKIADLDGKLYIPLPDGSVNEKKCDRVADTRNHYMLLVKPDGAFRQVLVSLVSTQIKKSKTLMSALANVQIDGPAGKFTPATFANMVKATSIPESNDKGTWHGWKFELAGPVERPDLYAAARAFNESVKKGTVTAKYEDPDEGGGEQRAPGSGF